MHISQQRLEIEGNPRNFVITCIVDVAPISETVEDIAKRLKFGTFFNISKNFKFKKNINLHLFQTRLEIERNIRNLVITGNVNVHSKTVFNISQIFKI